MRFLVTLWSSRIIINSARLSPWFFREWFPIWWACWLQGVGCQNPANFPQHSISWGEKAPFLCYMFFSPILKQQPNYQGHQHYSSALFSISLVRLPGYWTADYVDGGDAQLWGMAAKKGAVGPWVEGIFQSLVGWMTNETCEMTLGTGLD